MKKKQSHWMQGLARHGARIATALFVLAAGQSCANATEAATGNLVYVGTGDNQIRALRLDAASGKLTPLDAVAEVQKPRWTVTHPTLPILYAVEDDGSNHGAVVAFGIDRDNGKLSKINEVTAVGDGGTYLWLDTHSKTLIAASYGAGSTASIAVNDDGSLGKLASRIKSTGSGPNKRQATPHAHGIAVDPSGRYALVPDLGADRVFVYRLDGATHSLTPDNAAQPHSYIAAPGSGPRHLVFSPDGRFAYLLNELSADLITLRWNAQQGQLTALDSVPVSNPGSAGTASASEIALSRDGRFAYAGDRGENTLVVYRIDTASGKLSPIQRTASGGTVPWAFSIDPSGKWMLVANQGSGKVNVFAIDNTSGKLTNTGESADVPGPLCITFAP